LRIAADLFGMRENVPNEAPEALVLVFGGIEPFAKRFPRSERVERKAWFGLGDRHDELAAEALAKAGGHDKSTLVIKGMFGATGKARNFASQDRASISLH
jgi:hypothetical protein